MPTSRPRVPSPDVPSGRSDALLDRLLQPSVKRLTPDKRRATQATPPAGLGSFWALAHKTAPKK